MISMSSTGEYLLLDPWDYFGRMSLGCGVFLIWKFVCVANDRRSYLEELCLAELEHERRKAFGRMTRSIYFRFCYDRLAPFSREEVRYLEICAVMCRIDLRKSHLAALHNVIVCYMREVIQVYDLPQAWVKRESRKIMKWIQFRKSRLLRRRALLSLRR